MEGKYGRKSGARNHIIVWDGPKYLTKPTFRYTHIIKYSSCLSDIFSGLYPIGVGHHSHTVLVEHLPVVSSNSICIWDIWSLIAMPFQRGYIWSPSDGQLSQAERQIYVVQDQVYFDFLYRVPFKQLFSTTLSSIRNFYIHLLRTTTLR